MKEVIMKKWVKALRSGEYDQCTNVLAKIDGDNHSFCCLGVLCNIMQEETGELKVKEITAVGSSNTVAEFNGYTGVLPPATLEWAGIEYSSGSFTYKNGDYEKLITLNDDGKSFKEIADIIETNYETM